MRFAEPPREFAGNFSDFFGSYVAPNLPSPERVAEFDRVLRRYLDEDDPIYVVRYLRGQARGTEYRSDFGCRMHPTDNAPVWWLHAMLCSTDELPTDGHLGSFFRKLPCHLFSIGRIQTLNSAGYHAAHIVSAKNGDLNWMKWDRKEMSRRTLVNIHPCNVFLVAKSEWTKQGGRPDVVAWIARAYLERYGQTMQRFLADVGGSGLDCGPVDDPIYSYGHVAPKGKLIRLIRENAKTKARRVQPTEAAASLRALRRPCIWSNLVGTGVMLSIRIDGVDYILPHDDLVEWVAHNTHALHTASWLERGVYSWPRPSKEMLTFLRKYPF